MGRYRSKVFHCIFILCRRDNVLIDTESVYDGINPIRADPHVKSMHNISVKKYQSVSNLFGLAQRNQSVDQQP